MGKGFSNSDAAKAITNIKNWYPEISEIIGHWEDELWSLSSDHIVHLCSIIRDICNSYAKNYLLYSQRLALVKKELEELRNKQVLSCLSVNDYNELERITDKVTSCRLDKVTLNLNNGVSIIFNPPAEKEKQDGNV